jgi:hypothetical protein
LNPRADIQRWAEKAEQLAQLKAEELELRLELVAKYFAGGGAGTVAADVGGGHQLVAKFEQRPKLAGEEETRGALQAIALADPAGVVLADRLVKFTPELRVGEYKKLPPKLAKLIDRVLTWSAATPALELRAPKA